MVGGRGMTIIRHQVGGPRPPWVGGGGGRVMLTATSVLARACGPGLEAPPSSVAHDLNNIVI